MRGIQVSSAWHFRWVIILCVCVCVQLANMCLVCFNLMFLKIHHFFNNDSKIIHYLNSAGGHRVKGYSAASGSPVSAAEGGGNKNLRT